MEGTRRGAKRHSRDPLGRTSVRVRFRDLDDQTLQLVSRPHVYSFRNEYPFG
jgi:hypothetical protein